MKVSAITIGALLTFAMVCLPLTASDLEPRYGGTVVTGELTEPKSLNPGWKYDIACLGPCVNIYSKLVIADSGEGFGNLPYGDLAKSWDISDDGLTYTFHLWENVKWHDGVKCTSADVKYTYETMKEEEYPAGTGVLKYVDEIETPDDNTVVLHMTEVYRPFIFELAKIGNWYAHILPKHIYEGTDWETNQNNMEPIGTGPFKFEEWVTGDHITLVANEDYFRGSPYLDKVIYRFVPDTTVGFEAFKAGEFQYLKHEFSPPYVQIPTLNQTAGIRVTKLLRPTTHNIRFNCIRPPFNDSRVRRAIACAIDREDLNQKVWFGIGLPTYWAGPHEDYFWVNTEARYPDYDLDMAKQLLDEAGYLPGSDGVRLKATIVGSSSVDSKAICEYLKEVLKAVGIDLTWETPDRATWTEMLLNNDFDISYYFGSFAGDPDSYNFLFGETGARNHGDWYNAEVETLLVEGRQETDIDERKRIYGEIQEIIVEECPTIELANYLQFTWSAAEYHGFPAEPEAFGKSLGYYGWYPVWWEGGTPPPAPKIFGLTYETFALVAVAVVVCIAVATIFLLRRRSKE